MSKILRKSLLMAICVVSGTSIAQAQTKAPNFIVILADDQGWGTTSVMIDPKVPDSKSDFFRTPNIERLAGTGMRFCQGYASHCNCSPSRAALQTGRSPAALHFTDIVGRTDGPDYVGNKLIPPQHVPALPASEQTIPELLKAYNPDYRTAHFGKWHLGAGGPARFGYDESDGPTGNRQGSVKINMPDDPKKIFSTTQKAIAFMQAQVKAGHPFYVQTSYYATHLKNQSLPATFQNFLSLPKGRRHDNVAYGAMLSDMDTGIGRLLDAVKAAGIGDNTYLIYTSDNGCVPTRDPANINGPVHGYKATVWEGGIRVPFMVAGPGIKAGTVSRTPVVGYDILPTICELAGAKSWPSVVEGGSMKATLLGDGTAPVKRPGDFLVFHWPHYQQAKHSTPDTTLLAAGWKLHFWWETGKVQLYHLDQDLGESSDVAVQFPDRAAQMKATLQAYLKNVNAQLPVPNPVYNPGTDPARGRAGTDDMSGEDD